MQRTIRAFLVASTLFQPVAALAQAPDEAGARKIEEALRTHGPRSLTGPGLLSKPGVLKVSPDGDAYRLLLDMAKLMADAVAPMTVKDAAPLAFKLAAQADGKWVFDSSTPFSLTTEQLAGGRSATMALATETGAIQGVFDPAILMPREASLGFTNFSANLRDARNAIKAGIAEISLRGGIKDLPEGQGDLDGTFLIDGLTATNGSFPQPEQKLTIGKVEGSYRLGAIDLVGLAAMVDFWNGTGTGKTVKTLSEAERGELRALLAKHVPMLDSVGGKLVATGISNTQGGKGYRLGRLEHETRWEGLSGKSTLTMTTRLVDVGVDPGLWPPGLEGLVPKEAALNITSTGFDFGALWKDAAELKTPEEMARLPRDHFDRLFMPQGKMIIDLADSYAKSGFYDLTLSGQMQVQRDSRRPPVGTLTVTAKDLDGTVKYLQDNSKTVPMFGQVSFAVLMMKGLGKPGPEGSMVWDFAFDEVGKVTVNGQPMPMRR